MASGIAASIATRVTRRALLALCLVGCSRAEHASPTPNEPAVVESAQPAPANVDHSRPGVIVVLGSSTSAGIGPTDPKNAWVRRYQAYLAKEFPAFKLTNLAVGGQTTYHIQATGFTPPAGRPSPVTSKNISVALALAPSAIIVNMPSNDAAANIPWSEQLANYERIAALANAAHALLWVTTSQPRNFDSDGQQLLLTQARDAIKRKFGPRVLDFWTPFAGPSASIEPQFDSGDGTHLNDAAHATLASIVIAAHIPETVLATP
jgi:lysophospholipase L1-like esterase